MNDITGTLKIIHETLEYGTKGFRKREFILTTPGKYPQDIKLELYQDDCSLLDSYKSGDDIEASYNIKGNEYNGKYYVNLQAWKIKALSGKNSHSPDEGASPIADSDPVSEGESPPKKRGRPKKAQEAPLSENDLTENITELADAPF